MKLLDFRKLPTFALGHQLGRLAKSETSTDEYDGDNERTDDLTQAEVVLSAVEHTEGSFPYQHRPILDIDFPVVVLPSSTEGHHHLYLDKKMSWTNYAKLLKVLAEVGIIEEGYHKASIARQHTSVRLPWVKKAETAHLTKIGA